MLLKLDGVSSFLVVILLIVILDFLNFVYALFEQGKISLWKKDRETYKYTNMDAG